MDHRVKILFTIPNFDTAGSGKVVYDLVKGLDKAKFDVSIACTHDRGEFFKEVQKLGVPIFLLDTTAEYRPYHTLYGRIKPIIKFFKENQFEIIHSWHWSSDWTEVLAAKFAGVKWLYTKKAMSWGNKHWKIRSFLADYIITINHEMVNYFSYKKNQKLIPIGIDINYYSPEFSNSKEVDEGKFNIVAVANLVPVKGIEIILKAMHKLNDQNMRLKVVGNDEHEYAKTLRNVTANLGLKDQVMFTGKMQDVRPFINKADVYIIPTLDEGRKEGMPIALVEAMSMAIPVLGSDISGINFVLKDFPELMFEASNEEALAMKILHIKNKGENYRRKVGNSLRKYSIEHFSVEQFVSKHEELYLKLAP